MNRKITEEFEGDLTNEKVNQIIEKYGLPTKLDENMPGWRDGSFLNDFVTRYFTNGACVSAYQNSSFGAVIIAAVCWGLPVLIGMFFGGSIWLIVDSMPIFLVMPGIVNDIYEIWYIYWK